MKNQTKLEARERIAQILACALLVSSKKGYMKVTRDDIAEQAKVPPSLISYHLGTMPELRRRIMREAIRTECLPVIAQGIGMDDRHLRKAPNELIRKAILSIRG